MAKREALVVEFNRLTCSIQRTWMLVLGALLPRGYEVNYYLFVEGDTVSVLMEGPDLPCEAIGKEICCFLTSGCLEGQEYKGMVKDVFTSKVKKLDIVPTVAQTMDKDGLTSFAVHSGLPENVREIITETIKGMYEMNKILRNMKPEDIEKAAKAFESFNQIAIGPNMVYLTPKTGLG